MKLRLQVLPPSGVPFEFQHAGPMIRIGRDPASDLAFESSQDNVSWEHARVTLTDKAATLTDLGSTNGTFLNGANDRVKTCALKVGDDVRLGQTGPRLKVMALELAKVATVLPAEPRRPKHAVTAQPAASISSTRKLLIHSQSRNRQMIAVLSAVFLLLLMLISTVIWLLNRQLDVSTSKTHARIEEVNQTVDTVKGRQDEADKKLDQIVADVRGVAGRLDDINKQQKAERDKDRQRIDQAVNLAVREAARMNENIQAELRRLQEQGKKLDANRMPVADLDALNKARGGNVDPSEHSLKFKPGLVLSIRKKNSGNRRQFDYENMALVHATPDAIYLQWFEDKPKEVKVEDIETIAVKNQIYNFDPRSKSFEPGVAHYRLDRASAQFVRQSNSEDDLSVYQRGTIVGESPTFCLIHRSAQGISIALPKNVYGSTAFPAKSILEVVTNFGVFVWSEAERDYVFQTHQQYADKYNAERDKARKEQLEEEWKKRKEAYQLVTERLKAVRPYWWHWW